MKPEELLVKIARNFVGTKEIGGDNRGPMVEAFQKAVDGVAMGEAWCLSFVQYCVKQVDKELKTNNKLTKTEHVMTLWNHVMDWQLLDEPFPGCLAVWQHFDGKTPTMKGHVGIVAVILDHDTFLTVEGNTGPDKTVNRDGDGVYLKTRFVNQIGSMRLLGFVQIWD